MLFAKAKKQFVLSDKELETKIPNLNTMLNLRKT